MKKIIIAIDGHSSCGKSTFAKALARKLKYNFVDTGAMYRAITLYALRNNLQNSDLIKKIDSIEVTFRYNAESEKSDVYLNNENVETQIRTMKVSENVSRISALPEVRAKLVAIQQQLGKEKGIVMDGRDIGTAVFPNAEIKIFMTADPKVRAKRRYDELTAKGDDVTMEEIEKNIVERDFQDENREVSPLKKASDAILLDNSHMTVEQQMTWVNEIVNEVI